MEARRRLLSLQRHLSPGKCSSQSLSPLEAYRRLSSFNPEEMARFLVGESIYDFKQQVWQTIADDPLFRRPEKELSIDEMRRLSFQQLKRVAEYDFLTDNEMAADPLKARAIYNCLGAYDWSLSIAHSLHFGVSPLHLTLQLDYPDVY